MEKFTAGAVYKVNSLIGGQTDQVIVVIGRTAKAIKYLTGSFRKGALFVNYTLKNDLRYFTQDETQEIIRLDDFERVYSSTELLGLCGAREIILKSCESARKSGKAKGLNEPMTINFN